MIHHRLLFFYASKASLELTLTKLDKIDKIYKIRKNANEDNVGKYFL